MENVGAIVIFLKYISISALDIIANISDLWHDSNNFVPNKSEPFIFHMLLCVCVWLVSIVKQKQQNERKKNVRVM